MPAQTLDYVAAFRSWAERAPGPAAELLGEMTARVESLAASQAATTWIESFDAYGSLLEQLGTAMGRPVLTVAHLQLRAQARSHGLVYKSCGAGGGDLGVVLSTDPERLDAFCRVAWSKAAHPLNLTLDPHGASARSIGPASAEPAVIA
jgi:phosphomevalonate kinase